MKQWTRIFEQGVPPDALSQAQQAPPEAPVAQGQEGPPPQPPSDPTANMANSAAELGAEADNDLDQAQAINLDANKLLDTAQQIRLKAQKSRETAVKHDAEATGYETQAQGLLQHSDKQKTAAKVKQRIMAGITKAVS